MNCVNLVGVLNTKPEITLSQKSKNRVCTFLINVRNSKGRYCNIKCVALNDLAEQMYTRTIQGMTIGIQGELDVEMRTNPLQDQDDRFKSVIWVNSISTYKNNKIERGNNG